MSSQNASGSSLQATGTITVKIQTTGGGGSSCSVTVDSSKTVAAFKEQIKDQCACPPEQQRLIYRGRILKDHETLTSCGIAEGHTVHLVRGSAQSGQFGRSGYSSSSSTAPPSASATNPTATTPNATGDPFGGMGGLMMGGGMPDMQRMQEQLAQNPEMMRNIMNSPMMQNLMDNPETLRSMMTSNPQMRALLDSNPQLNHILNDPSVLRQTMEMARNPAAMQQAIRNQDLALSQIENVPGGFNALTRMYHEVQEPMLEAAMGNQSSDASTSGAPTGAVSQEGALPNPWATPTPPAPSWGGDGTGGANAGFGVGGMANPFAANPGVMGGMPDMGTMMQNPAVQSMMSQLMSNPAMMQQMIDSNPMLRQMVDTNPGMRTMLSDPAFLQQATSPAAMQAMQAMAQNQSRSGAGVSGAPMPFPPAMFFPPPPVAATPAGSTTGTPPNIDFSDLLGNIGAATVSSAPRPPPPASWQAAPPAGNSTAAPTTSTPVNTTTTEASTRYATQQDQLKAMGFSNEAANHEALTQTNGNLNAAVERLLGQLEG